MAPTIRRAKDVGGVLELLEPHEPHTTLLVAPLQERGLGRHDKAWVVEDDGVALGVLVVSRVCRDRWRAFVHLLGGGAAPLLARQIEALPVSEVGGLEDDVARVASCLTRLKELHGMRGFAYAPDKDAKFDDHRRQVLELAKARRATRDDLDALVELFSTYELDDIPTVPRLRQVLEECFQLDRPIMVIERDGTIAGAMRTECQSARFAHLGSQSVLPEHRGQGLSMQLLTLLMEEVAGEGRGTFAVKNAYNPIPTRDDPRPDAELKIGEGTVPLDLTNLEEIGILSVAWGVALIQRRYKFRGAARIHQLIERLEGPISRRAVPAPYPTERTPQ